MSSGIWIPCFYRNQIHLKWNIKAIQKSVFVVEMQFYCLYLQIFLCVIWLEGGKWMNTSGYALHLSDHTSDFALKQTFKTAQISHTSQGNWPNLAESWPPNLRPVKPYWHHEYKHKFLGFSKEKKKHFVLQHFSISSLDCTLWQEVKTFKICCTVDGWQASFYGWSGLTNFSHFGLISTDPIIQPFCFVRSQHSHTVLRLRLLVSVRCDTSTGLHAALNNECLVSCRKVTRRDGPMSWTAAASAWVQERLGVRWGPDKKNKTKPFQRWTITGGDKSHYKLSEGKLC